MEYLFQNKKKNILAICFSLIHLLMLIINGPFWGVTRLAVPIALLVLLFTVNKEYRIKKWILPVAFGIALVGSIRTLIANIGNMRIIGYNSLYFIVFMCSILITVAGAFMFVGVLLGFKNPLKYGALAAIVLTLVSFVVDFFAAGGFKYIQSVPDGISVVNFSALALRFTQVIFYVGIFILATNKPIKTEQKPE